jgi:hypothetical protein
MNYGLKNMPRVLYLGVFKHGSAGIYRSDAIERSDCKVERYPYREREAEVGAAERDKEIVKLSVDKDIVIFPKCYEVDSSVVSRCKENGATTVFFHMDPLKSSLKGEIAKKLGVCDLSFFSINEVFDWATTIRRDNVFLINEGFDPLIDFPVDVPFVRDVGFIGNIRWHREKYHQAINFDVIQNAYGHDHAIEVCKTKINLNFTHGGTSDRTYKILAAGGFLLTEPWDRMPFKKMKHLDVFTSVEELRNKIDYWIEHEDERMKIAAKGMEEVQKFSWDTWAAEILIKVAEFWHERGK